MRKSWFSINRFRKISKFNSNRYGCSNGFQKIKAVVIKGSSKTDVDNAEFTRLARIKKNKVETHKSFCSLERSWQSYVSQVKKSNGDSYKNHQQNTFEYAHNMDGDALKKYVTHNILSYPPNWLFAL